MASTLEHPLYEIYDNVLPKDFCKHVIDKFEVDDRSSPAVTLTGREPTVKDSQDLLITGLDDWNEFDGVFYQNLLNYLSKFSIGCSAPVPTNFDHGFQIQRTTPDQIGYNWHSDFHIIPYNNRFAYRIVTYIFYLNDVEEGGETEFWDNTKIKPKTGRLLLFSSDIHHVHRGCRPISNTKYIVTGWAYKTY